MRAAGAEEPLFGEGPVASPRWLVTPGRLTIAATGTIACTGAVDGRRLSGEPGPMAYRGAYDGQFAGRVAPVLGDTCLAGSGTGTWEATLAMEDGTDVALSGPMHFEYVNAVWLVQGELGPFVQRLGQGRRHVVLIGPRAVAVRAFGSP